MRVEVGHLVQLVLRMGGAPFRVSRVVGGWNAWSSSVFRTGFSFRIVG